MKAKPKPKRKPRPETRLPLFLPDLRVWLKKSGLWSECPQSFGAGGEKCKSCGGSGEDECACDCGQCSHTVDCEACGGDGVANEGKCVACGTEKPKVHVEILGVRLVPGRIVGLAGLPMRHHAQPAMRPDVVWLEARYGTLLCTSRDGKPLDEFSDDESRKLSPKRLLRYSLAQQILPVFTKAGAA